VRWNHSIGPHKLIHMPHRTLPGFRKWCKWRQEAVPVGHPHPEWDEKYPWSLLGNIVAGRIFTDINIFVKSYRGTSLTGSIEHISKQSSMQVWRLFYTNLVGPRGEKLESTEPFWCFFLFTSKWEVHMSFPRELCSCRGCSKGGSMDTIHLWRMQ
jgi:hypothetical protein